MYDSSFPSYQLPQKDKKSKKEKKAKKENKAKKEKKEKGSGDNSLADDIDDLSIGSGGAVDDIGVMSKCN